MNSFTNGYLILILAYPQNPQCINLSNILYFSVLFAENILFLFLDIFGCTHSGNTPAVYSKAHGISRKQEHITVIINIAGIRAGTVQSGDGHEFPVTGFTVFIDTDTAHSSVTSRMVGGRIKRRFEYWP